MYQATERILCAAIWLDDGKSHTHQPVETGLVYCGHRHHVIIGQLAVAYGMAGERRKAGLLEEQGFLTATGCFVDREEAMQIALDAHQVVAGETQKEHELYSEDLY